MTIRNLPAVELGTRTGVQSDVSQSALSRWEPSLRAEGAADDGVTISIMDVIGHDFWGEGATAKDIARQLRAAGNTPVQVVINSPGGDVFEGLAIYNVLRAHKAEVSVKIVGLAASAASFIAMAGDRIEIGRAAFLMIHNSWVCACGDRQSLRDVADWLEPFDQAMVDIYEARTELDAQKITAMMDAETWINGQQAVDQGFADALLPSDQVSVDPDAASGTALRAERAFDVVASRAGLSRSNGRQLLSNLKGGKSGAASTGKPGAAEIAAGVEDLANLVKSLKGQTL